MKIHELKLDIKYFDEVKNGHKNFEIRKNDRDYQIGDVLELKAYKNYKNGKKSHYIRHENDNILKTYNPDRADTITAKVTCILSNLEVNEGIDFMNFNPKVSLFEDEALPFLKAGWRYDWNYEYFLRVLKEYFHTDKLPDGHVVIGVEVIE